MMNSPQAAGNTTRRELNTFEARMKSLDISKYLEMSYSWPGNVRELNSALEYAFVIAESGRIGLEHLPPQLLLGSEIPSRDASLDAAEKVKLIEALRQSQGNQSEAARVLQVRRVTVWNRMRRHGIDLKKVLLP
jgi:transcriptional regulator of acetoin/glycerol metabolism